MRLFKSFIFLFLLASLVGLFYLIQHLDEDDVQVLPQDHFVATLQADSLLHAASLDSQQVKEPSSITALYEDYEVGFEVGYLVILKSNRNIGKYPMGALTLTQLLVTDLNGDDYPECWVLAKKPSRQVEIFALNLSSGPIKRINFPNLKGSQSFGYAGHDTLYLEKSSIVRQFKFANDPYSDLESGQRVCFYQFGKDLSFVLKKTIDLE